jgi:DnaJ-class molecular chaperone
VTLSVLPHPYFRRAGNDVTIDVPLAVHEAALGTRIDVPTLDGSVRLRVPPGTQSGQTFRLRQRGVPMPDGSRGDLVATARVVLPPILDQRSRELLREFGTLHPEDVRAAWGLSEATRPQRPATSDQRPL